MGGVVGVVKVMDGVVGVVGVVGGVVGVVDIVGVVGGGVVGQFPILLQRIISLELPKQLPLRHVLVLCLIPTPQLVEHLLHADQGDHRDDAGGGVVGHV